MFCEFMLFVCIVDIEYNIFWGLIIMIIMMKGIKIFVWIMVVWNVMGVLVFVS